MIESEAAKVVTSHSGTESRVVRKANTVLRAYFPKQKQFVDINGVIGIVSSLTVGMTESAFNIRITHIDRTPNKTSHYIANIQTCLSILEKRGYGDLSAEVYKHL